MVILFVAIIGVAAISSLINSKSEVAMASTPTESTQAIQPAEGKIMTPQPTVSVNSGDSIQLNQPQTEALTGSGVQLKDASSFPVTIVVTHRIDILSETGGFGLDAGHELLVLRKQDAKYFVNYKDKEYAVNPNLIEDMRVK